MNVTPLRCLGLSLAFVVSSAVAQVSTSCIPTKNQVVLRQRVAELEAAEGRLDTRILQAEVDALKRRGMINEQQAEEFAAIIEQAQAPKGPVDTPEGAALARQALAAKVTELQSAGAEPIPESDPEVHAKASAVLEDKMKALRAPAPAQPEPDYSARQAVALAALASVMTEMSAAQPVVDDDSDEAIQAKAQAALAEKMAELDRQAAAKVPPPVRTDAAAQKVAQQALAEKMAELDRQAAEAAKPPPVAPTVAAPRPAPVPTAPPPPAAPVVTAPAPVDPPPPAAPVVVTPAPRPAPAPAPAPKPVVVTPAPAPKPPPVAEVVVAPGEDHRAAALAALESKMADLNRQEGVSITGVPVQPPPVPPREHLQATQVMRETVAAPFGVLETPPAPKTGWDRLNELTDLYRTNQITPREYHVERAKIMEALAQ
jgi:hypothetical protein